MKKILKFKESTEGQSLVEFALVLPILMLLVLGMIEFGWILNGKITLTSAAREGARVAITYESAADAASAVQNAVIKSSETSSLIDVSVKKLEFKNGSAIVIVTAKIKPIIGLYVGTDIINLKEVKAEMKTEN